MEMNIYVLFMKICKFGIQKHMTFIVWYAVCYMYLEEVLPASSDNLNLLII